MGLIHIELFATLDLVGQSPGGPDEGSQRRVRKASTSAANSVWCWNRHPCAEVALDLGVRDQAREQVGVVGKDHRVAVAVGHEHRQVEGAQPLEQRVVGNPQVHCSRVRACGVAVNEVLIRAGDQTW